VANSTGRVDKSIAGQKPRWIKNVCFNHKGFPSGGEKAGLPGSIEIFVGIHKKNKILTIELCTPIYLNYLFA
jgi:hypothetical protein